MSLTHVRFLGPTKAVSIYDNSHGYDCKKPKVISHGKKCERIDLVSNADGLTIPVALISKKVFNRPQKPSLFEYLFGKSFVNLHVTADGKEGFIKVNAKSLRKRLNLTKNQFHEIIKASPKRNTTDSVVEIISVSKTTWTDHLNQTKADILLKFETHDEIDQIHSAKILFRFPLGGRFNSRRDKLKMDFTIRLGDEGSFDQNLLSSELDKMFDAIKATKVCTTSDTKIVFMVIFKTKDGSAAYFSSSVFNSKIDPSRVNDLCSEFSGKLIFDSQYEFI